MVKHCSGIFNFSQFLHVHVKKAFIIYLNEDKYIAMKINCTFHVFLLSEQHSLYIYLYYDHQFIQ